MHGGDINLWNADPNHWQGDEKAIEGTLKRQKTGIKTVDPIGTIKNISGVSAMKWTTNDSIVTGSCDHQIKVYDVSRLAVQESVFTNHKTITCLDSTSQYVFGGFEDGVVRVFDLRKSSSSTRSSAVQTYVAHDKWLSQIKCNPQAENVFLTSSYDGKIKMWDLRNPTEPLSVLKRTTASNEDKVFALAWNGAS